MANYVLSALAQQNIIEIRDYTLEIWGREQTIKYISLLEQRLEWLAANPNFGKKRNEVNEGLLSYPEGNHIIFYRIRTKQIEIIAVLHQREDVAGHLNKSSPFES